MTGGIDKTKLNQSQDADVSTITTFISSLKSYNLNEADICIFAVNIYQENGYLNLLWSP